VYSFEPTPTTRQFLEKTIALNGLGNRITVFSEAVSSSSGQGDFFLNHSQKKKDDPMAIAEANALQTRITIPTIVTTAIPVKTISLDDFSLDHPGNIGFIKIDAEGSELEVLRGARKIFLQHRPYAIVGMHSFFYENIPATLNDFWTLMQEYHYDIFYNSQPLTLAGLLELKINELFDLQLKPR
jgi:FkbM family methyltransferase